MAAVSELHVSSDGKSGLRFTAREGRHDEIPRAAIHDDLSPRPPVCLSVNLSVCPPVCLATCPSVFVWLASVCVIVFVWLPPLYCMCHCVRLSMCLSYRQTCLSVCLLLFLPARVHCSVLRSDSQLAPGMALNHCHALAPSAPQIGTRSVSPSSSTFNALLYEHTLSHSHARKTQNAWE